jgi:hypothetical protein
MGEEEEEEARDKDKHREINMAPAKETNSISLILKTV